MQHTLGSSLSSGSTAVLMSDTCQPAAAAARATSKFTRPCPSPRTTLCVTMASFIVIGRACSDIDEAEARENIFGYSILNDACIRDMPEWTGRYDCPRGKALDTFAPFGPWIVPAEFLKGDPDDLALRTYVDGEERQADRTSGLLWTIARFVAFVSRYIRLSPGDVISTGSTSGNALHTGKFLQVGQKVRCEIEGIGVLENTWASEHGVARCHQFHRGRERERTMDTIE